MRTDLNVYIFENSKSKEAGRLAKPIVVEVAMLLSINRSGLLIKFDEKVTFEI